MALDAIRVHASRGFSAEYDVERYYRDAPLMIFCEGTNEIPLGVFAKQIIGWNAGLAGTVRSARRMFWRRAVS